MITGLVTSEREAVIRLRVSGVRSQTIEIDAVIDTGFNGFLTLPSPLAVSLDLLRGGTTRAELGDGKTVEFPVFLANIDWDGCVRMVSILMTEGSPVVGMAMLNGSDLFMEVVENGRVEIKQRADTAT